MVTWGIAILLSGNRPPRVIDALEPAIRIARDGFPVYARMAKGYASRRAVMERYPGTREVYLRNGKPIAEGDVFRQPELAATLERLADKGFDGFYRGQQLLIETIYVETDSKSMLNLNRSKTQKELNLDKGKLTV